MKNKRSPASWFGGAALLALVGFLLAGPVAGQIRRRPPQFFQVPMQPAFKGDNPSQYSAIRLMEKSEYRQFIQVAQDCIKDKAWNDAATALQTILDNKEDFYVQIKERDSHGQKTVRWTSVKFEANSLLGSMPAEGLDVYEVRFGGKARQLLEEAKRKGDWEQLADVAQRFLHTKAGAQANELLATYFLDRGQYFSAALRYEKLLNMNPDRVKISDLTLYKTVLAYRRAGADKKADQLWKKLEPRLRAEGGLKIGEDVVVIAQLQQVLNEVSRVETANPHDWPLIRGNITNSAQASGSPPLLDLVLWQRPLCLDKDFEDGTAGEGAVKGFLDRALDMQAQIPNNPVLPGFYPITTGNQLIYRTYTDIRAVALREEKDSQGKVVVKPGEIIWKTISMDASLANILGESELRGTIENWLNNIYFRQPGSVNLLYENTLLGTLATDHRLVYAVDDLAVPAPINIFQFMWNTGQVPQRVKEVVSGNKLLAFDLNGKNTWHLGGPKEEAFADSHFLGVPLSVGGKLYVLNEKNNGPMGDGELRLVSIDPNPDKMDKSKHQPAVVGVQPLGWVQQQHRVTHDMSRRLNAVHLAYGEGILVCPTNAGEVLGVDLLSRSLAWAYPYREQDLRVQPLQPGIVPAPFPGNPGIASMVLTNWRSSPPVIQDGKVVFTAPDASSVHCINLRNGLPVWKAPQMDGDQFLGGVFNGKVVIVGRNACRLLRLDNGAQEKYIPFPGEPTGQGVACKNVYYLPIKNRDKNGEILAIDLERGLIKARNRASRPGTPPPGNLLFHEGVVVSETAREVVAYPQLAMQLELASEAVLKDPGNPEKLFKRGEFRLYDGQVQEAVDDLHKVLDLKLSGPLVRQAKNRLYEALTDLFQINFNKASAAYLDEFRELCSLPDDNQEKQQRLAKFFRVVGQGREDQGNLVEAFKMYREFGELPINKNQGVAALDDPTHKVPAPVWLRGRIAAMIARATPRQREPLEKQIALEWKTVQAKKDLAALRNFVNMFDVPFQVGREARLELAEAIMDKKDRNGYLEAELCLQQLRTADYRMDPAVGGRALADLALLEEKKGNAEAMKLAAAYYRRLGRDFPSVAVRGGKTGSDLLNDLAVDKRFLPYLEESGSLWNKAKIKSRELPSGGFNPRMGGFIFYPEGDLSPWMSHQRLILDPSKANNPSVRLVDLTSGTVRWSVDLGSDPTNANFQYFQYLYQQSQGNTPYKADARFRFFQVKGHLAVFQVGTTVYAIDLDSARILWQHSLLTLQPNMVMVQQVMPDADGFLNMMFIHRQTGQASRTRVGQVGAVQASYVALLTQKGLVVLNPLDGSTLWSKMDVPVRTRIFGDDQYLFLLSARDGGETGAGRVLRASNGEAVNVPDFGHIYRNRVHLQGRHILAATLTKEGLTLRRYDILAGKDLWSRTFAARAVQLHTEDPDITGVILPDGKLIVLETASGRELLNTPVRQPGNPKIQPDDLKNLSDPLLLQDKDRFYLALNHPVGGEIAGGFIGNNFSNGLRCTLVNGWFLAYHRHEGQKKNSRGETISWKKGDFAWHYYKPITNQMMVLDQFQELPVILFSARYNKGGRWLSLNQGVVKKSGLATILDKEQPFNSPQFYGFYIDLPAGTINMVGFNGTLQHYIDDERHPVQEIRAPGVNTGKLGPLQP